MAGKNDLNLQKVNKNLTTLKSLKNVKSYFCSDEETLVDRKSVYFENLRYFITFLQKLKRDIQPETKAILKDISGSLLHTLASCAAVETDGGMLTATAFCSALSIAAPVTDMVNLLNHCLHLKPSQAINTDFKDYPSIAVHDIELFKVCLCYGMLSNCAISCLLLKPENHFSSLFLPTMLNIVEKPCMKYSCLTSTAFKVLARGMQWAVLEAKLPLGESEKEKVFSVVVSNWENPISGVKDNNTKAFDLLMEACTEKEDEKFSVTNLMKHTMQECSWSLKSKYYMLNVLLPKYGVKKAFKDFEDIVSGLVSSLRNSYLVPAGSNVYKTCINQMEFEDWRNTFMTVIVNILSSTDENSVVVQNMIHYWLPGTLKKFPELLTNLTSQLMELLTDEDNNNLQLSVLCLLHFRRKEGQLLTEWHTMPETLKLVHDALQHSNELIRAEAFAIVCTCPKTTVVPSHTELVAAKNFLMENVNIDDAVLRCAVLKSWSCLVSRINASCLYLLKVCTNRNEDVKRSNIHPQLQFLNEIRAFLISNLVPGANYQRKILSLKLYDLTLQCFCKDHQNKLILYAKEKGYWKYDSEKSLDVILNCVADPTEDIRETAAKILTQYFMSSTSSTVKKSELLLEQALKLCCSPIFYEADSGAELMKVARTWSTCSQYKPRLTARAYIITRDSPAVYNKTLENQRKLLEGLGIIKTTTESPVHISLQSKPKKFERTLKLIRDFPENIDNLQEDLPKFEGLVCLDSQDKMHPHCSEPVTMATSCDNEYHELSSASPLPQQICTSVHLSEEPSKDEVLRSKNLHASEDFQQSFIQNNDDNNLNHKQESVDAEEACPVSVALITLAEEQLANCKQDLLGALISGSSPCGILCAINKIAMHSEGPEYNYITSSDIDRIVTLLEDASTYMLHLLESKTQSTEWAPSFAEMDAAIQNIIHQFMQSTSAVNSEDEDHTTQLSPAHQLILNCIWLSLKACCNLASDAAAHPKCSAVALNRCGQVIVQVLLRCRHKGAIEAAGSSLCGFVKYVTKNSKDLRMLEELLEEFLNMLECGNIKVSVSRRSAGLSILTHRIVSNDMRPGKPFLHLCINHLLRVAKMPVSSNQDKTDLPQAQAMHSLRMLVQDASLHQETASYLDQLTLICFGYFSSSIWTIRNAALQLSGALIPKLVRQNKMHDEDCLGGSTVSIEEFFNHYYNVAEYMLHSLRQTNGRQEHSMLIPMLSLLIKLSITSKTFLSPELTKLVEMFCICFFRLLKSPIYHVRKLSAKALERFTPLSKVPNLVSTLICALEKCCNHSTNVTNDHKENNINGMLLALKYLIEKLKTDIRGLPEQEATKTKLGQLRNLNICFYFNKILLLEILADELQDEPVNAETETFGLHHVLQAEERSGTPKPGLYLWASRRVERIIKRCPSQQLLLVCHNLCVLFRNYSDITVSVLDAVTWRTVHDNEINSALHSLLLLTLTNTAFEIDSVHSSVTFSFMKVLLTLVEKPQLNIAFSLDYIKTFSSRYICKISKTLHNAVALPVVMGLLHHAHSVNAFEVNAEFLEFIKFLAECVLERSDPRFYIEEYRYYTTKALPPMVTVINKVLITLQEKKHLLKATTEALLQSFLLLLQDENTEVRKEAAKSAVKYFPCRQSSLNPHACIHKLLEPEFLVTVLSSVDAFAFLCTRLSYTEELHYLCEKYISLANFRSEKIVNPFNFWKSNFYAEENKIVDICGKNLVKLLRLERGEEKLEHFKKTAIRDNIETDAEVLLSLPDEVHSETASSQDASTFYSVACKLSYLLDAASILVADSSYNLLSNKLKSKAIGLFKVN